MSLPFLNIIIVFFVLIEIWDVLETDLWIELYNVAIGYYSYYSKYVWSTLLLFNYSLKT